MNNMTSYTMRLQQIESEIESLEKERQILEDRLLESQKDQWSEAGLTEQLRKVILSRFGSFHNIKMAKLLMNSSFDVRNSVYEYTPILVLLDANFIEVENDINPMDFAPSVEALRELQQKGLPRIPKSVTLLF